MQNFSLWSPAAPFNHAHLMGICGAGMKALAEFLIDRGWKVSGCDGDPDPAVVRRLHQLGIDVQAGHDTSHPTRPHDTLIFSAAIGRESPERRKAAELGIPQFSYTEALANLSRQSFTLAIAGTHGKSSTTALLGQILQTAQRPASVICGGENSRLQRSGWGLSRELLIVEACEFRRHFLTLTSQITCVLGIEPDHFDCYPTLESAEQAYLELLAQTIQNQQSISHNSAFPAQPLIVRSDCPSIRRILNRLSGPTPITFSLTDGNADWRAIDRSETTQGFHFRLQFRGETSPLINLAVPGRHNILNAMAAAACARELGIPLETIALGLGEFRGLRRRFEQRKAWHGAPIIDDYAHHPTEIRATLTAARQAFPGKQLVCVFQPHQISRTAALLEEFASALNLADKVYLLPIYAARETGGEVQAQLSREIIRRMSTPATFLSTLDQVWGTIQTDADTDAVILTLGAGNLSRIHHEDAD